MTELQESLYSGLELLKEKGSVSVTLTETAHSFSALIEDIDSAEQAREDWTPSNDEEAYVYIDKTDETAASVTPKRGQSFHDATNALYYEITEAHRKGPQLTSRYRCRIVRDIIDDD